MLQRDLQSCSHDRKALIEKAVEKQLLSNFYGKVPDVEVRSETAVQSVSTTRGLLDHYFQVAKGTEIVK